MADEASIYLDRVAFMAGEIHALLCFALAVAESHPNRQTLKNEFEAASQSGLAKIETTLASDKTVAGFQEVSDRILRLLAR